MVYIKLFVDYLDAIEPLGDAERGRLFTALLEYARTGEAPQLNGNERFLFPMMRAQIDRDEIAMSEVSDVRSAAGKKGAQAKASKVKQNKQMPDLLSKTSKDKEKEKDEEKDKDDDKEEKEPDRAPVDYGFGEKLSQAFADWLQYKQEKRQGYKPKGLENLVAQVKAKAKQYGEDAVADLIAECMASNWQGIIWDKLEKKAETNAKQQGAGATRPQPGKYTAEETKERQRRDMEQMKEYLKRLKEEEKA